MSNPAPRAISGVIAAIICFLPLSVAAQAVQRNPTLVPAPPDTSQPIRDLEPGEKPGAPAFVNPPGKLHRPQHSLLVDPVVQSSPSTAVIAATSNNFPGLGN